MGFHAVDPVAFPPHAQGGNGGPPTPVAAPSHLAALEGHLEICEWYIKNFGDVNNSDDSGWTALHFAVNVGQVEIFKYLMENGADLCLKDDLGQTSLHAAAEYVPKLRNFHSSLNLRCRFGQDRK